MKTSSCKLRILVLIFISLGVSACSATNKDSDSADVSNQIIQDVFKPIKIQLTQNIDATSVTSAAAEDLSNQ